MKFKTCASALLLTAFASATHAVALRVATAGDALSMDPDSLNETLQLSFTGNIYEGLVGRDKDMNLVPLLATGWKQTSPTVWTFTLRKGVAFHDGTPFTADDVVFSFARAAAPSSDLKSEVASVKAVRKVGDDAVEIETIEPFPILPSVITNVYIMSRQWCVKNKAEVPVDRRKGIENTASFKANGTGPFRLRERQPGTRTVLDRYAGYYDKVDGNVDEVVFTPIANDATRTAALLSGEVDLVDPVPLQDVDRVRGAGIDVLQGPELRTIFVGMDESRDELQFSNVKGRNPFKDRRVREALYQAVDIDSIRSRVMHDAVVPTGLLIAPLVKGYPADLNHRLPYNVELAKKLLMEAGYPNGFQVGMNCPNDRYVNDAAVCQALAANFARIGVKVDLMLESKASYFPKVMRRETSLFLLGWTPGTVDALDPLYALVATPGAKGQGQFNLGAYSNPAVDDLVGKIGSEMDRARRDSLIHQAYKLEQDDVAHIPLYQQTLAWGCRHGVKAVQLPTNRMYFKWIKVSAQ